MWGLDMMWWTVRDSNPPPPQCHCGALPNELTAHVRGMLAARTELDVERQMGFEPMASTLARLRSSQTELLARWWTVRDSNPRPPRCERGALPSELRGP